MNKIVLFLISGLVVSQTAHAQHTLYDDTRLSSIYITIPGDSLQAIYDSVLSDHYYMARFVFDDGAQKDTLENTGFRLRGNTSRYSKKKSFKVSFNEYVPGRKYQGVKKLNLNGEHNDPTMIREKLFYDLWKRAGMVERRTSFVRLYINQAYYGLYTNLEEMDDEWLDQVYECDSGNLYKCTYPADLAYHGPDQETYKKLENSSATGGRVYDLQTNKQADDYSRLVELMAVLNKDADEKFAMSVSQILDVNMFLRALALDVATGNWDDYAYNQNNYYLYDNPADSRFRFITYDPDNTFGVDWFGIDWSVRDCRKWINQSIYLPLAQKLMYIPAFYDNYKRYLDTIARTVISPEVIFPRIDSLKQLIYQAAAEDTYRTLDYGYTLGDFNDGFIKAVDNHTPIGIKPFLEKRKQAILDQLASSGIGENSAGNSPVRIYPNPVEDHLTIIFAGRVTGPLTVTVAGMTGAPVSKFFIPEGHTGMVTVPVQTLLSGIYILHVENEGKAVGFAKFIRQ